VISEAEIEAYLVRSVKEMGGEVRKVQWIGRKGAPDRIVMLPPMKNFEAPVVYHYGRTFWVELKAAGLGALFPHTPHERQQHREHERMRAMGQVVVVIDSYHGVEELLK